MNIETAETSRYFVTAIDPTRRSHFGRSLVIYAGELDATDISDAIHRTEGYMRGQGYRNWEITGATKQP